MNRKNKIIIVTIILAIIAVGAGAYLYWRSKHVDILVYNGIVLMMHQHRKKEEQVIQNGAVAIRGDTIIAVGESKKLQDTYTAKTSLDAHGDVIMPGLINGHTHAAMTLLRGAADDHSLHDWLENYIFPLEKKFISPEFVYWGTLLAIVEMIQGGTTTAVDMYFHEDQAAKAFFQMGMRAIVGQTTFTAEDIVRAEELIKQWNPLPLITPAVAPHAPHTGSQEMLLKAKALSDKYKIPLMMHIAETDHEVNMIRKKYGLTPVEYLHSLGVLTPQLIAAHGVKVTDHDIELMRDTDVGIVHNPTSNMKLASGAAPVQRMIDLGADVGLGTDGAASNNSLDMFAEMKIAALLQKHATGKPEALNAYDVLRMATIQGAKAIDNEKEIGSLEPGKKADLIIVDLHNPHTTPFYDVMSQLVYATKASDVATVIINGKIIMLDKKLLIDKKLLDELAEKTKSYQEQIAAALRNQKTHRKDRLVKGNDHKSYG